MFEWVRRNEEYKAYCEKEKETKAIAELYEDLGDIHTVGFKSWWRKTGR